MVFEAAESFTRSEGNIVAPETAHAVQAVYDEAMACKESGEAKVILFNCSGHGHFDLGAYDAYHRKELPDYELEAERIEQALVDLPKIPA
jgi:tryptophan synthase beta chain